SQGVHPLAEMAALISLSLIPMGKTAVFPIIAPNHKKQRNLHAPTAVTSFNSPQIRLQ
ncbi:MAG: hypothetical protein GY943_15720, partial [Chloroflexi bacterium]|nr:hypothetical protein [Chloroflexota bacterium]